MTRWFEPGMLFVNRDPYWYDATFDNIDIFHADRAEVEETYHAYFTAFTKYRITDLSMGVYTQTSLVPSKAVAWMGEKYTWQTEGGIPVDYTKDRAIVCLWRLYRELHLDPMHMFAEIMREHGIRPWLALRMNDVHHQTEPTHRMRSPLFYTAEKDGWLCGPAYEAEGRGKTLNYGIPAVRNMMTAYIEEIANTYDVFGYELDYMRETTCLDYKHDPDCHRYMTEFIREVRRILDAAGEKWGHPIRLMVRVPRSPDVCRDMGLAVDEWITRGYIDAVAPAPRWECSDSCIPVHTWRDLIGERNVALLPSAEAYCVNGGRMTIDMLRAFGAAWYAQGADGFYPYNKFDPFSPLCQESWMLDKEACLHSGTRRFVLTYQDTFENPMTRYVPLPLNLYWQRTLTIPVGAIRPENTVTVNLTADTWLPPITMNGVAPEKATTRGPIFDFDEENKASKQMAKGYPYTYTFTGISTDCDCTLHFSGTGTILYVEIIIQ